MPDHRSVRLLSHGGESFVMKIAAALKASNGTVLWRYQMGLGFGPYSRAAVVNGVVYVGSEDGYGYVYALTA